MKKSVIGLTVLAFAVFIVLFFYTHNRYYVLCYHEQIQLFRIDSLYFYSYLGQPGGILKYIGSFLTRFYVYPFAGAVVIATVITSVLLLFYSILHTCDNLLKLLFLPFVPAILLMMAFVNIYFDMASALGLLFVLACFRIYLSLQGSKRYFAGFGLLVLIYFTAAGNVFLFSVLILIDDFFRNTNKVPQFPLRRGKGDVKFPSFGGAGVVVCLSLVAVVPFILPWIAWQTLYTVPIKEAYFALTPLNDPFMMVINIMLWLSLPVIYLFWRLIASFVNRRQFAVWKMLIPNLLLTIIATGYGAYKAYDSKVETLYGMIFETQNQDWQRVITLSKSYPAKNRLSCYYTNLALANLGVMPDSMFHFKQTGVSGLFLDRDLTYFSLWYVGEAYYHLGMMFAAEHCAFEAMVGSPKEPNAQTLQRLVYTCILRRDSASANKYIRFFEKSPTYRQWAAIQRKHLEKAMADATYTILNLPTPMQSRDFFIDYQAPDRILIQLLNDNPTHRIAFEYLMAYYMLQKDMELIKWCFDAYYANMNYPAGLPTHYEEALMVYKRMNKLNDDFYSKYPVRQATRERYNSYIQAFMTAQGVKRNIELLQKRFGDTYWFYLHFNEPATLQKSDEKNRY